MAHVKFAGSNDFCRSMSDRRPVPFHYPDKVTGQSPAAAAATRMDAGPRKTAGRAGLRRQVSLCNPSRDVIESPGTAGGRRRSEPSIGSDVDLRGDIDRGPRLTWALVRESFMALRQRLTRRRSSDKTDTADGDHRSVTVEIASVEGRRSNLTKFVQSWDTPYHDYSSYLTMTSLKHGRFTAELSLRDVPPGDLTLRAENHRILLIITGKRGDSRHRVVQSYVCGYLQLPIYVDPFTLQLWEVSEHLLHINCQMKGYVEEPPKGPPRLMRSFSSPSFKLIKRKFSLKR